MEILSPPITDGLVLFRMLPRDVLQEIVNFMCVNIIDIYAMRATNREFWSIIGKMCHVVECGLAEARVPLHYIYEWRLEYYDPIKGILWAWFRWIIDDEESLSLRIDECDQSFIVDYDRVRRDQLVIWITDNDATETNHALNQCGSGYFYHSVPGVTNRMSIEIFDGIDGCFGEVPKAVRRLPASIPIEEGKFDFYSTDASPRQNELMKNIEEDVRKFIPSWIYVPPEYNIFRLLPTHISLYWIEKDKPPYLGVKFWTPRLLEWQGYMR